LGISKAEAIEAIFEIKEAVKILAETGTLPTQYGYYLHKLEREPWAGFLEFHVADDILIVYADVTANKVIRLIGIYNHDLLRQGKID
jgi:mRNA interferase YafQ